MLHCQHTVLQGLDLKAIQLQDTKDLFFLIPKHVLFT